MKSSYTLVSLYDMLKLHATQFLALGRAMEGTASVLYQAQLMGDTHPLTDAERSDLRAHLTALSSACDEMGLKIAKAGLDRAIRDLPSTSREFEAVIGVVGDELKDQLLLFVPTERAKFYEAQRVFPDFPNATKELVRAGNCFAASEDVACVFHSMRAVEIALTAVYLCMGLTEPTIANKSWGNYCNGIRDEMTKRGNTWAKKAEFQEILTTLVNVKDGWRNTSLHVDAHYSETDAKRILESVTYFIEKVSSKMNEHGQPLA